MGEKLLAQRLIRLLRDTNGRSSRTARTLLDWLRDERDWLWPDRVFADREPEPVSCGFASPARDVQAESETLSWERLGYLADLIDVDEPEPAVLGCVDAVSELLAFDAFEREVLRIATAFDRLPRLAAIYGQLLSTGTNLPRLVGRLAGAQPSEAARRVRRSGPVRLGLVYAGSSANCELDLDWRFIRVLDAGLADSDELVDALAGLRQPARLAPEDFAEQRDALHLLVRLLSGALAQRAEGVNVLIYGPPGTGKTEFARTLAAAAGASLYAVGECDADGEEPSRQDRLSALRRAQRLLARRGAALLLFDEMEDLFADASLFAGRSDRRTSSKIFVNRLLEGNAVPTIWTSNAIDQVDPAHLRRMSYILRMAYPTPQARARIVARVAEAEGVAEASEGLGALLPAEEGTAGVARAALRAAALAGGGAEDAEAVGRSLLLGLRGGRSLPPLPSGAIDLDLYEADRPIAEMAAQVAAPGTPPDVSVLLTGPPGTGKTALAAYLAARLDRPMTVKRASDLLSPWVGGTEANIAAAFAEARERGSVLLFDEADSLLLDRTGAQRSWEISQVNELLTWMDSHPLPFIAATNYPQRLDPAALRRFVFKIGLRPLSPERAERAFARFFGAAVPAGLARIEGLTPGDFAVVARQLLYRPGAAPGEILALLEAEARAKPEPFGRIGF